MTKPKYKGFYNIVKNESKKEATIYIYGVIGGFNYETWTYENTADQFVKDFKQAEAESDVIHIKINSPGGSVHDGLPIYNAIVSSKKTVYTYVDGIAYSMAALIALAGSKVYGFSNSLFMVHNVWSVAIGNANDMRTEADVLDKYDASLSTSIQEKLSLTEEEVKAKYLNYKDNFYTAKESKEIGFFDELITSESSKNVPDDIANMSKEDIFNHYAKMNIESEDNPPKQVNTQPTNTSTMSKNREELQAVLGLDGPLAATEEHGSYLNEDQLDAVENRLTEQATAVANAQTEAQTAKDDLATEQTASTEVANKVNALAALANAETGETVADTLANLENRINEMNAKPGDSHTTAKKKENEEEASHPYMDFDTPFYNKAKSLLN